MPYYLITLTYNLPDGDSVDLQLNNIEADDQAAALDKLPAMLGRLDELKGNPIIDAIKASSPNPVPSKIDIKPVPAPPPVDESRFLLQHSQQMADGWVVADTANKVVVTFREHRFNETRRVTFLDDAPHDHLLAARILREMGDWLSQNHKDKL